MSGGPIKTFEINPAVLNPLAGIQALLTTIDADTSQMVADLATLIAGMAAQTALLTTIDADTGALVAGQVTTNALLTTIDADTSILQSIVNADSHAVAVPPPPEAAQPITPVNGADPLAVNMVAVEDDDVEVTVTQAVSAFNGATAVDIELFVQLRDGGQIIRLPGGRRDDLDVYGSMPINILPGPVGQKVSGVGARSYYVGGPPTYNVNMRRRK